MKSKRFNLRLEDWQDGVIRIKAKSANMSITDYMIRSALDKRIVNFDGLEGVTGQLKRMGNNINQLVLMARKGRIQTVSLENFTKELSSLHEEIRDCLGNYKE